MIVVNTLDSRYRKWRSHLLILPFSHFFINRMPGTLPNFPLLKAHTILLAVGAGVCHATQQIGADFKPTPLFSDIIRPTAVATGFKLSTKFTMSSKDKA
jgi:hypothetical protein